MFYSDYSNDPKDRNVSACELFRYLADLRGEPVSSASQCLWKKMAGVCVVQHGMLKPDKRRMLSPRESAGIVLLALWQPLLRKSVEPSLRSSQIKSIDVPRLFDKWMASTSGSEAATLLQMVYHGKLPKWCEIHEAANHIAKKKIPRSTMADWARRLGGRYQKNAPCPPLLGLQICLKAKAIAPH